VTDPTVEFTDPYLGVLRPVPPSGPGVCRICHSGPSLGFAVCASCDRVRRQLSRSTEHVLPISLSVVGLQLHQLLWRYKNVPEGTSTTERTTVAAMLARFVNTHLPCIEGRAGGPVDLVTAVPSTSDRAEHPLVRVVDRSRRLSPLHRAVLTRGSAPVDHDLAGDDVFATRYRLDGARAVLIDDTLTSGARLQSAASTLLRSGARSVVALVVGRVVDPDWNDACRAIWGVVEGPRLQLRPLLLVRDRRMTRSTVVRAGGQHRPPAREDRDVR
jgi:hypothetical protein